MTHVRTVAPTPKPHAPSSFTFLQRKCACHPKSEGACEECRTNRTNTGFPLQTKLTIGAPTDVYEQEADRVAEAVMRAPDLQTSGPTVRGLSVPREAGRTSVQRQCARCRDERERASEARQKDPDALLRQVQRTPGGSSPITPSPAQLSRNCECNSDDGASVQRSATASVPWAPGSHVAPPSTGKVVTRTGSPLDAQTRAFFEPRFGRSFGDVRVHTDAEAAASANDIAARAYTIGRHLVFASGSYDPSSVQGRRLLAHELTHVAQQTGGGQLPSPRETAVTPSPGQTHSGTASDDGPSQLVHHPLTGTVLQRDPEDRAPRSEVDGPAPKKICRIKPDATKLVLPGEKLVELPEGTSVRVERPLVTDRNGIAWANVMVRGASRKGLVGLIGSIQAHSLHRCIDPPPAAPRAKEQPPRSPEAADVGNRELTPQDAKACTPLYLHKLCLYDRGASPSSPGVSSISSPEDVANLNQRCREEESAYEGEVTLSEEECRMLASPACARGGKDTLNLGRIVRVLLRSAKYIPGGAGDEIVRLLTDRLFLASVAVAIGGYLLLWVVPEPFISKVTAILTTLALLATGLFSVSMIIKLAHLWEVLASEASNAETDEQIETAAKHFGHGLGGAIVDLLVFLASLLVGGRAPGPKRVSLSPAEAMAQAERQALQLSAANDNASIVRSTGYVGRVVRSGSPSAGRAATALKFKPEPDVVLYEVPRPAETPAVEPLPAAARAPSPGAGPKGRPVSPVLPGLNQDPAPDEDPDQECPLGTMNDPIPMTWFKPLSFYPRELRLFGISYPRDQVTPLDSRDSLGVPYWPSQHSDPIQKTTSPGDRKEPSRAESERFKRVVLNEDGNFRWDIYSPDHVLDLAFGGQDDFSNIWPMDRQMNALAGTWHSQQPACYRNSPKGKPIPTSISQVPKGKWFKLTKVRSPITFGKR